MRLPLEVCPTNGAVNSKSKSVAASRQAATTLDSISVMRMVVVSVQIGRLPFSVPLSAPESSVAGRPVDKVNERQVHGDDGRHYDQNQRRHRGGEKANPRGT